MDPLEAATQVSPKVLVWMDFAVNMAYALGWPVMILAVFLLFRKELNRLARRIGRGAPGDAEAILDGVADATFEAKSLDAAAPGGVGVGNARTAALMRKAEASPGGAIGESFRDVEDKLSELQRTVWTGLISLDAGLSERRLTKSSLFSGLQLRDMQAGGLLTAQDIKLLEKLREIRNRAAHARYQDVSVDAARDFIRLADQFIGALGARISSLCGFELYRDRAGDFRYRLKAETGETLLVSAGHKDGLSAQEGIRSAWTCAAQEELYERRQTSSGKWIFNLRTPDGRVIGTSLAHDDEAARDRAMERMKAIFHAAS